MKFITCQALINSLKDLGITRISIIDEDSLEIVVQNFQTGALAILIFSKDYLEEIFT